jgi:hypothetical protein
VDVGFGVLLGSNGVLVGLGNVGIVFVGNGVFEGRGVLV